MARRAYLLGFTGNIWLLVAFVGEILIDIGPVQVWQIGQGSFLVVLYQDLVVSLLFLVKMVAI